MASRSVPFVLGTELRVEAGLRILEDRSLHEVHVPHPETDEPVLVTREKIREHGDADYRVLVAAQRYREQQLRWHERLITALEPRLVARRAASR